MRRGFAFGAFFIEKKFRITPPFCMRVGPYTPVPLRDPRLSGQEGKGQKNKHENRRMCAYFRAYFC